jgi:kynureninase
VHSHPKLHEDVLSPEQIENAIIAIGPREGEDVLRTEDIIDRIDQEGDEVSLTKLCVRVFDLRHCALQIAVVWLSGVQYYTGQFFDIPPLCKKAHEKVHM